jgi:hypothetical protein
MSKTYTRKQIRKIEEQLELGYLNGAMCTDLEIGSFGDDDEDSFQPEDNPTRFPAEAEKVYSRSKSNSFIVLGKDRMGDVFSGFGGRGTPNSNAIDLVAGMGSSSEPIGKRYLNKDDVVDPNPFTDAARVYISQRTDLDGHFGITEGEIYPLDSKQGVSGIAMKADSVLVLGRRNIKIKAGQSHGEGFSKKGETDAHGTELPDARIELIADGFLEPMVKGDKLVLCLEGIYEQVNNNRGVMAQMISQMLKLRTALMLHTHPVGNPIVTFPSPELIGANVNELPKDIQELYNSINEMILGAVEELNSIKVPNKDRYILSKNVFTS